MRKKTVRAFVAVAAGAYVWILLVPYAFDLAVKHGAPEIGGSPVDIYAIALYCIFAAVVILARWVLRRACAE